MHLLHSMQALLTILLCIYEAQARLVTQSQPSTTTQLQHLYPRASTSEGTSPYASPTALSNQITGSAVLPQAQASFPGEAQLSYRTQTATNQIESIMRDISMAYPTAGALYTSLYNLRLEYVANTLIPSTETRTNAVRVQGILDRIWAELTLINLEEVSSSQWWRDEAVRALRRIREAAASRRIDETEQAVRALEAIIDTANESLMRVRVVFASIRELASEAVNIMALWGPREE